MKLRYLQVQTRTVEELVDGGFKPVAELEVDGELWASWDEAVEHVLDIPGSTWPARAPARSRSRWRPGVTSRPSGPSAACVRERCPVDAVVRVESEHCPGPYPLTKLRVADREPHRLVRA